jgi:hypothetical protein
MKKLLFTSILLILSLSSFSQSYLGWVKKQAKFREGPGIDYKVITSLKQGKQIFIISSETENNFYNIIDIATDKEGYLHKSFVKIGRQIKLNEKDVFQSIGKSSSFKPEVEIFNNTSLTLSLKLNEDKYSFSPNEKKVISLSSENYNYRASAPGVIPLVGAKKFESNMKYSWEFYVLTKRR